MPNWRTIESERHGGARHRNLPDLFGPEKRRSRESGQGVRLGGSALGLTVCARRWRRKRGSSRVAATCVYNAPRRRVDAAPDGAGSPVHWSPFRSA